MATSLDIRHLDGFVREHELQGMQAQVTVAHEMLHSGTGAGNDFLGWLTLPYCQLSCVIPVGSSA